MQLALYPFEGRNLKISCFPSSSLTALIAHCLPARVRDAPTIGTFKYNVKLVNMGTIIEKAHFKN